ncbi:MAG: hypothetical protein JW795_14295 [Chitinivibrionales bacterium]|nr:hypothetical protein [Chitinivibrionales bacterium]
MAMIVVVAVLLMILTPERTYTQEHSDRARLVDILGIPADSQSLMVVEELLQHPLCVPCGDVCMLSTMIPEWSDDALCYPESLRMYEPWDGAAQNRFFKKYPFLVQLQDILTFSSTNRRVSTQVRVAMTQSDIRSGEYTATIHSTPNRFLNLRTSVLMNENSLRWRSRTLKIRPDSGASITIGNFPVSLDHGLSYGYFFTAPDETVTRNWLYGGCRNGNGIIFELQRTAFQAVGISHIRASELIAGCFVSTKPFQRHSWLTWQIGVSTSRLRDSFASPDSISPSGKQKPSLHCALNIDRGNVTGIVASTLADITMEARSLPLFAAFQFQQKWHRQSIQIVFLPVKYRPMLGLHYHQLLSDLGVSPVEPHNASLCAITMRSLFYLMPRLPLHSVIKYSTDGCRNRAAMSIRLSSSHPTSSALTYSLSGASDSLNHAVKVLTSLPIERIATIVSMAGECDFSAQTPHRFNGGIIATMSCFQASSIRPRINYDWRGGDEKGTIVAGIGYTTVFFRQNFTEIRFNAPLSTSSKRQERVSFYAASSFFF